MKGAYIYIKLKLIVNLIRIEAPVIIIWQLMNRSHCDVCIYCLALNAV